MELGDETSALAQIQTGPGSSCEIVFGEKNIVRIAQNTITTIDFAQTIVSIDLEKGGVASVLRKLNKVVDSDSFQIRTAGTTAGVRGTSLCIWANEDSTYICACNGSVHTIDAKGNNEFTISATHHKAKLYTYQGDTITSESAGLLHHSDEDLEKLAAKIGETIDWSTMD